MQMMRGVFRGVVLLAGLFAFSLGTWADPATGWKMTAPGTYNLSDPANWVNGDVNGVFGADLELEGDQVIAIDADLTFANGMTIQPVGTGKITFTSSGTRTLSVGDAGLVASGVRIEVAKDGTLTINGSIRNAEGRLTPAVIVKAGAGSLATDSAIETANDTLTIRAGGWIFNGAISGTDLTLAGGEEGTASFFCKSTSNTMAGRLVLDGALNQFLVEFQTDGAVSESMQISIRGTSVLRGNNAAGYPCSYFTTKGLIAADSDGRLGFGSNYEPGDIDLRNCPDVILGSHDGNYSFSGRILVNDGALLRLGGNKHLYLTGANALSGNHDVLVRNANATTYVQASNDMTGRIVVDDSGFCIKGATVSLPNVDLEVRNNSSLFFQTEKGAGTTRVKSLTLKSSMLTVYASSQKDVEEVIAGDLVVDGECGGCSFIKFASIGNYAFATCLKAKRLVMPVPGVLAVEGPGLGSAPGANACNLLFDEAPALVGGGGAAGTAAISILPRVVAGATANGAEEGSVATQTFATYEDGHGIRPLDLATEFATAVPEDDTLVNLRIPFGQPLALTANARVNAVLFQGGANTTWTTEMLTASEGCGLAVASGQILCGQRAAPNATYTRVPIDFGAATGTVLYGSKTTTCLYSPLSGSAGVVLGQVLTKAAEGNKLMRFFNDPKWTLTGDVYVMSNCRIDAGCIPSGERTGDLRVMGGGVLWHGTMTINGLFGGGTVRTAKDGVASTLTVGSNGADGDFSGTFGDAANYSLVKTGAGTQRLSGAAQSLKKLTVSEGEVQVDTTLTAPVTVADGAGLAVGAPADGVTHEIVGDLTFEGAGSLACEVTSEGANAPLTVRGDVTVPEGRKVAVSFSSDADGKEATDILLAQNVLSCASFARVAKCPRLILSEDGHVLRGAAKTGLVITVR